MANLRLSKLFGAHFQLCFCAFLLRDSVFLNRVARDLSAEFFSDDALQRVVRLILGFYAKQGAAPSVLIYHSLDQLLKEKVLTEELHQRMNVILDELFRIDLQNRDFLLQEFDKFIRFRRIELSLPEIIECADAGRLDDADRILEELRQRPSVGHNLGRLYSTDVHARVLRRHQEAGNRCWTLIREIDGSVDGLRGGEIGVFQSQRSSVGKTAMLVTLARNFAFSRKRVLFFSLEESEGALEDRLDQCLACITREELMDAQIIERRIRRYLRGQIWLCKLPDASTTVGDLKRRTQMLRSQQNFRPDVVIIDYADLLIADDPAIRSDKYETGKAVYGSWREWMQEDNIPGWTGMQSSRDAGADEVADQHHSAGSIAKPQFADVVISINRPGKQVGLIEKLELFIVKNRDGIARRSIPLRADFARMRMSLPDVEPILPPPLPSVDP